MYRTVDNLPLGASDANPRGMSLVSLLGEDFATHGNTLLSPGFWAIATHRFGNWRMSLKSRVLRIPLTALYRTAYRGVIALWGIDLPYNVKVGRRVRFPHHGCMVLGAREIGDDVVIWHGVTIGLTRRVDTKVPAIGNRVEISSGVCIAGDVRIGDDSYIGPNTVVIRDLPNHSRVLGIPIRPVDLDSLPGAKGSVEGTPSASQTKSPMR